MDQNELAPMEQCRLAGICKYPFNCVCPIEPHEYVALHPVPPRRKDGKVKGFLFGFVCGVVFFFLVIQVMRIMVDQL